MSFLLNQNVSKAPPDYSTLRARAAPRRGVRLVVPAETMHQDGPPAVQMRLLKLPGDTVVVQDSKTYVCKCFKN